MFWCVLSRSLSRSLRQGGACHCTSASELNHLCGILGGGWGQGPARNHVMSDPEREPSVLCHGWPGPPHPSIPIPSPPAAPSPAPPTVSPACASPLGVSLELQVADSWFKSRPPCCFSALLESRVNLALFVFSIIVGFAFLVVMLVVLVWGSHSSLSQPPSRS